MKMRRFEQRGERVARVEPTGNIGIEKLLKAINIRRVKRELIEQLVSALDVCFPVIPTKKFDVVRHDAQCLMILRIRPGGRGELKKARMDWNSDQQNGERQVHPPRPDDDPEKE